MFQIGYVFINVQEFNFAFRYPVRRSYRGGEVAWHFIGSSSELIWILGETNSEAKH
jgi:hypothetical protein